jgi:hypothetical protein
MPRVESKPMKTRHVSIVLCVAGLLLPCPQFVPCVMENGLNMRLFVSDLFANRIGGFFGMAAIVSALVLWVFVRTVVRRLGMRKLWLPMVAVLVVGVSLGLPLFLYLRQAHLDRTAASLSSATPNRQFGLLADQKRRSTTAGDMEHSAVESAGKRSGKR